MIPVSHPAHFALGLIVWSIWFVVIYGGLSIGCAVAPPSSELGATNWLNGVLGAITLAVTAWLIRQAWRCWRASRQCEPASRTRFTTTVGAGLYTVAAISTIVIGLPIVGLPPCL